MAVYGNVNVKYAPCKSAAQLHSAADYILGKKKEQLSSGVIKTKSELYNAFGCNRDNFANSVLMTRWSRLDEATTQYLNESDAKVECSTEERR